MFKLWKHKKIERTLFKALNVVPKSPDKDPIFEDLQRKLLRGGSFNREEFAILYYASLYAYNYALQGMPDVVIAPLEEVTKGMAEVTGASVSELEEALNHLYITLALSKPDGRAYCEGSYAFTEEEYLVRQEEIQNDIAALKDVATPYIPLLAHVDTNYTKN